MTSPRMTGDSCQRFSMACYAPEITTVSNPKGYPASDADKDQQTIRCFNILTPPDCL
jgi:hypothetical protein